jgi:ATP-binding cassette, subfamily C, bacterial CydD
MHIKRFRRRACDSHGMKKPVRAMPEGAGAALAYARCRGAAGLREALIWQSARVLARLGFAASLAVLAGAMIEAGRLEAAALGSALLALIFAGGMGLVADIRSAEAEAGLADAIRGVLQRSLGEMRPARLRARPAGALIASLQRHPEAVAGLAVGHAAAGAMLAIGPLAAAIAIAVVSWQAALALVLATPVMIVFLAIVGGMVRERAEAQEKAFGRLAAQFSDRIRTLPTILANHALEHEHAKIEDRMTAYARSTMVVLRSAFLNAGIIDFFSALSIAVLAVFLGLGHLGLLHMPGFYGLRLWQSLFILIVAADYFTPFRRYAEQYHLKAEGEAAAKELDWYFEPVTGPAGAATDSATFVLPHVGKTVALELPRSGMVAISGPSGAGKSTLLRALAGIEEQSGGMSDRGVDWISTDIYVPEGTLGDAIAWNRKPASRAGLLEAAKRVWLLDDRLLPGGLDAHIEEGGENLSGGQRMRIGVARILLSSGVVLADEPTAKLDPATAALVRGVLVEVARDRLVVVATHDEALINIADRNYVMDAVRPSDKAIAA